MTELQSVTCHIEPYPPLDTGKCTLLAG